MSSGGRAGRAFWLAVTACLIGWPAFGPRSRAGAPAAPVDPADPATRLIAQLGDEAFARREAAERELLELGEAALPGLRRAAESDDPEVSVRARRILNALLHPAPQVQQQLRDQGQQALAAGDYAAMEKAYRRLCVAEGALLDDRLWLARACQLAGRWREAVAAYQRALAAVDEAIRLSAGAKPGDPEVLRQAVERGLSRARTSALTALVERRADLLLLVGRLQRGMLRDPPAAIATLSRAMDYPALLRQPPADLIKHREQVLSRARHDGPDHNALHRQRTVLVAPLRAMRELAAAQQEAEKVPEAIDTLSRVALLRVTYGVDELPDDVGWLAHLVQGLPLGTEPPPLGVLTVLTPEHPSVAFGLDDVQAMARTRGYALVGPNNAHWLYFAVAAAPGLELASVAIEQEGPGTPFTMYCSTAAAGRNGPPGFLGNDPGRYELPSGAGLLRVSFAPNREHAPQQLLRLGATFAPRGARGPQDGDGPWDAPGRRRQVERERPDGPFGWQRTQLRYFASYEQPFSGAQAHLARLPDGRWLVAFGSGPRRERRILLATSQDLVHWGAPQPLPVAEPFESDAPALLRDHEGTVWLAYRCDALEAGGRVPTSLWLTSTRDGRAWSRPRPILGAPGGRGEARSAQMLRAPDGRYWLFAHGTAACAKSLAELPPLEKIRVQGALRGGLRDPSYAIDGKGRFHLVFLDYRRGLLYSSSGDGRQWAEPRVLVPKERDKEAREPQILAWKDRLALVYRMGNIEWLHSGPLEPAGPRLGEPRPVTHFLARMNGSRLLVTEREALALTGAETVWLLRAKLDEVFALPPAIF